MDSACEMDGYVNKIKLIGAAIDACASTRGSADTPDVLNANIELKAMGLGFDEIYRYTDGGRDIAKLEEYFTTLANSTKSALSNGDFPIIVGGDHSCAIGSWSGIAHALHSQQKTLGLIWIDAHMDAHTPDTSKSGNIHGMPVASLLGLGYKELITILDRNPKLKPENIILIGIRSFEAEEEKLLQRLGVQIYYNFDVNKYGLQQVFHEAWTKLVNSVDKVGLSIDLDGFDPVYAPGVGTLEPDGVDFIHSIEEISKLTLDKLVAVEITEGNNHFDPSGKTMQCIVDIIKTVAKL